MLNVVECGRRCAHWHLLRTELARRGRRAGQVRTGPGQGFQIERLGSDVGYTQTLSETLRLGDLLGNTLERRGLSIGRIGPDSVGQHSTGQTSQSIFNVTAHRSCPLHPIGRHGRIERPGLAILDPEIAIFILDRRLVSGEDDRVCACSCNERV